MSSSYLFKRENATRVPSGSCQLSPPLRLTGEVQYDHVLWNLPLIWDGVVVRTEPPQNVVIGETEADGERLWTYRNGSAVGIHDGRVIVYAEQNQLDLLDARTGTLTGAIQCPGALEGGASGDTFVGYLADGRSRTLFGCDLSTRELMWRCERSPAKGFCGVFCTTGGVAFVGLEEGSVIAVRIDDGTELWRSSVADLHWNDPTFGRRPGLVEGVLTAHHDLVIVRVMHGYVLGLSAHDGERVWTWRHPSARLDDGYLYEGRYYVNSGAGTYHILDALNGGVLLSTDLQAELPGRFRGLAPHGPMLVSETHVFIGTIEGYLLAFARDTGRYEWSFRPKGGTGMGPYLMGVDRRLYYTDMSFRLYCLEEIPLQGSRTGISE